MIEIQIEQKDIDTLNAALNALASLLAWEREVLEHWTGMHQIAYDEAVRTVQRQTGAFKPALDSGQALVAQWEDELRLGEQSQPIEEGHIYDN